MDTLTPATSDNALRAVASNVDQSNSRTLSPKPKREPSTSKTDIVLKKLRSAKGASLQQLADATGWQLHSVRGFLSAIVRKKLNLNLVSDVGKDEVRRYRIVDTAVGASS